MATWPLFLIALYWSSQQTTVEAKRLPNEHLEETTDCLRDFIGEEFVHKSFKGVLSYGEYLGDLCKDADIDDIEEKVTKDDKGHGLEVKKCLAKKNLSDLFEKIRDYGINRLKELEKLEKNKEKDMQAEESQQVLTTERKSNLEEDLSDDMDEDEPAATKKDDKIATSKTPQTSPPSGDIKMKDDKLAAAVQTAQKQSQPSADISGINESQKLPGDDSDEIDPNRYSDLGKFVIGMCLRDDSLNFTDLDNDEDKQTAFDCLENCASRFFVRIENSLLTARAKIISILEGNRKALLDAKNGKSNGAIDAQSTLTPEKYDKIIKNFKEKTAIQIGIGDSLPQVIYKKFQAPKDDKQDSAKTILGIEVITSEGIPFMDSYSKIYSIIDKYLGESDIASDDDLDSDVLNQLKAIPSHIDDEESLDSKLRHSFIVYKSCSKVQCYMKVPKSVPFYNFIHKKAKESEDESQSPLIPQKEEQETSPELKFYVALTHQLDVVDDDDDDDDSSSSEEPDAI